MLLQGQVDVIAIFTATSYMNLVALKLDPDKDFRWIYYADSGLDLYSNGVMVSQKLAKEKPEAVKGLVRAINKAMRDVLANPDAAIDLIVKKEALINKDDREAAAALRHPDADRDAGGVRAGRRRHQGCPHGGSDRRSSPTSFELPRKPAVADVFSRAFLPPKDERMLAKPTN